MPEPIRALDRIRIAAPCDADWDSMIGNDQVRACEHCHLQVRDLSAMTRSEAMRLVARSRGRLCVRYVQGPDGAPLIGPMPEKLHRIGRRVSRIAAGAFSATLSLSAAAAQTRGESNPLSLRETVAVARVIASRDTGTSLSGVLTDRNGAIAQEEISNVPELTASVTQGVVAVREPDDPMVKAAYKNDLNAVKGLAQSSSNLNAVDKSTRTTALAYAVEHANRNMVRVLLSAGADVNAANRYGQSPLMYLGEGATIDLVRDLLAAGANVNATSEFGMTPLLQVVANGKLEVIRELIAAGANIDAKEKDGTTLLMNAAGNEDPQVVRLLLKAGLDASAKNQNGQTALMLATKFGRTDAVKALLEINISVDAKDENGKTALMYASESEDSAIARMLIDKGADVNRADAEGATALLVAAAQENSVTMKLLIAAGADINARDSEGRTALMRASEVDSILVLLNAGADLSLKDNDGRTALSLAREYDDDEVVKLLVSRGAPE